MDRVTERDSMKRTFEQSGMEFEEMIERSNLAYDVRGKGIIQKIHTPWKVKRGYNSRTKKQEIYSAFPDKSTVDFGGTAQGKAVWFDAKRTENKKSFPLANVKAHQIDYLVKVYNQGGKAFLLVYSAERDKTWLLWIYQLIDFMNDEQRKSIPFEWFDLNCKTVKSQNGIMLDYLEIVLEDLS